MPEKTLPAVRPARMPQIDRARELLWLAENQRNYAGQWVALDGDRLLGAGSDPCSLLATAHAIGSLRPLVIHVPTEDQPRTGGWL